jgi:hypothetical protein
MFSGTTSHQAPGRHPLLSSRILVSIAGLLLVWICSQGLPVIRHQGRHSLLSSRILVSIAGLLLVWICSQGLPVIRHQGRHSLLSSRILVSIAGLLLVCICSQGLPVIRHQDAIHCLVHGYWWIFRCSCLLGFAHRIYGNRISESDGLLRGLLSLLISQIEMNVACLYMLTEIVVEERMGSRKKFHCCVSELVSLRTDLAFYLNADPDSEPGSQTNKDPCRSGSWSDFKV